MPNGVKGGGHGNTYTVGAGGPAEVEWQSNVRLIAQYRWGLCINVYMQCRLCMWESFMIEVTRHARNHWPCQPQTKCSASKCTRNTYYVMLPTADSYAPVNSTTHSSLNVLLVSDWRPARVTSKIRMQLWKPQYILLPCGWKATDNGAVTSSCTECEYTFKYWSKEGIHPMTFTEHEWYMKFYIQ